MPSTRAARTPVAVLAALLLTVTTLLLGTGRHAAAGTATDTATDTAPVLTIDGSTAGRTFDGVGGISAGASSRLLWDYPARERAELLDYLFRPNYGASLQLLKVEIGGDTNSTDGAEASHERRPGVVDCDTGYEWWLMQEARARNPHLRLYALEWGAPSWFRGGFWSADNVGYIQSWLRCARHHHLDIDYVGGWNERGFDAGWYEQLHAALRVSDPHVQIVADDAYQNWAVATAVRNDPALASAVDVIGTHDPCGARGLYQDCPSTADALATGKPLWASETSSEAHDVAAGALARSLNRDYLDGGMTGELFWSVIASWYSDLPIADTGLILADTPWSGHYSVGSSSWGIAHTTQFVRPGWRYLSAGSRPLAGGATAVSLRAPDSADYSTVVETMDATTPQRLTLAARGGLSGGTVHEWASDFTSSSDRDWFRPTADIHPRGGRYTVTLQPGHVYTFSTTTGQHHGDARPAGTAAEQLRLPFRQDFDHLGRGRLAPYFSDLNGGFQTQRCRGRDGGCYGQQAPAAPIQWNDTGAMPPTTLVGDPRWWGDYDASADVLLDTAAGAELLGRVEGQIKLAVYGYHLRVGRDGTWSLYSQQPGSADVTLAGGSTALDPARWHRLRLRFRGTTVTAYLDHTRLAEVTSDLHSAGQVGLRATDWAPTLFDDVSVRPTSRAPGVVPHATMTATATNSEPAPYRGYTFPPSRAIDDRTDTLWHTQFQPERSTLPQSITLDLHHSRLVDGLAYRPRVDSTTGMVTGYRVLVSNDGRRFDAVGTGSWPVGSATRYVTWPRRPARYVRFEATAGVNGLASAAELNVLTTPLG